MGYRKLDNVQERIRQAAITLGANQGIKAISARNIAKMCDISTHTIYQYYHSINELIEELITIFENFCLSKDEELIAQNKNPYEICDYYFFELIKHKDFLKFYLAYTDYVGAKFKLSPEHMQRCSQIAKAMFKLPEGSSDEAYLLLWEYVTTIIFKFIRRHLENEEIYNLTALDLLKHVTLEGIKDLIR